MRIKKRIEGSEVEFLLIAYDPSKHYEIEKLLDDIEAEEDFTQYVIPIKLSRVVMERIKDTLKEYNPISLWCRNSFRDIGVETILIGHYGMKKIIESAFMQIPFLELMKKK